MPQARLEDAIGAELLDAIVVIIGHIDVPLAIHGDAVGFVELPGAGALAAPGPEEIAVGVELLDAVVTGIGHVEMTRPEADGAARALVGENYASRCRTLPWANSAPGLERPPVANLTGDPWSPRQ